MSQPSANPGRPTARLTAAKAKLAAEIREQLAAQGGAAHREVVIGRILHGRGVEGPEAARARRDLLAAFELHAHTGPEPRVPRLFDRPFGPDSYRWALDEPVRSAVPF